ncbi:MAG: hypothetical protein E7171_04270 [Firmicutes bacterium]|nr:hypothetical protein [Bacillota bacterium]
MKNNKNILIISSIIALIILVINIILTMIGQLYTFTIILTIIFIVSSTYLIIYACKREVKASKTPLLSIEDTIILKLEDLKSESITPIRNKKEIEIKDDSSIKKDLEIQRENNVTKEVIEEELSKTMFITDLKEKIKKFEAEQEKEKELQEAEELIELNKLIKEQKKK